MKKIALLGLSLAAMALGSAPQLLNVNKNVEARDATIIVKMKGKVDNVSREQLIMKQNLLLNEISQNITSNYRVVNRYTNIFNGFVLEVPSAYVSNIRYLDAVSLVNYNVFMEGPTSYNDGFQYEIKVSSRSASAETMEKPDGTNNGAGTFIAILDTGFYIQTDENGEQTYHHVFAPLASEDAIITQASLKAKIDAAPGFHGKYDETHSTYYNNKVPFYYDYGGDKSGSVIPDFDVYAEGQEHGTHVASIAGGNAGSEYEGVAPRSQMALMKVFTTYMSGSNYASGAYSSAVLNALEDCLVLGVDSINMSLGSNLNDFDDGEIVEDTIRALENKGTFVNVAAGNEGKGQWSGTVYRYWQKDMVESNILSSYANNLAAMTVASSQADFQFYGEALTIDGKNIQYSDQVTNYNSTSGQVIYTPERHLMDLLATGKDEFDFVYLPGLGNASEYDNIDVNGKIAVVNRGDITFKEKVDNAVAAGAIAVAIIDNTTATEFNIRMSFSNSNDYTPAVPVVFILNKDKEVFANSSTNKAKLLKNVDLDNPNGRIISDYSSDGMRYDLSIKPEIATPGENIKGAVLGAVDKYESMSGTSMATPNFAGAVALMIGEHLNDANYRKSINARLMSTAVPMKDNTPNHNFTSVRRQGAGLVNLNAAINSKVYLDGVDKDGNTIGKAKIELHNNDDIKAGKLDLSFAAINEGSEAVTYTAKTYVLAPALDEFSEELYPEYAGQKFQTIDEQLVEVFEETVSVPVGKSLINIKHDLSAEKKAALDADFETGCILEGYVVLEATDKDTLSIPYLGYYGDLASVSPVEPFEFEKEEGKIYNSDLLNHLITQNIGKNSVGDFTKAEYASQILAGYWADTNKISVNASLLANTSNLRSTLDGNGARVKSVGMNPYTGEFDANNLFMGNNGSSNTMLVQQVVNRSVKTNTITLTNKATGEVVLEDHMFDNIMGSSTDPKTGERVYPLYKSHFDTSFYDEGYFAHRAYTIIPLYDASSGKQVNYPDGEYEMKFEYQLSAGSTFVKSYKLTIESNVPQLEDISKVTEGGQTYYRFTYSDANLCVVNINSKAYPVTAKDGKVYADVPESAFAKSKTAYVNAVDTAFGQETFLTHVDDENQIMVYNKLFDSTYDFTCDIQGAGTNNQTLTFDITKNGKAGQTNGDIIYRMAVPKGLDAATLVVNSVNGKGQEKAVKVTKVGELIEFSNTLKIFHLTSERAAGSAILTSINVSGPTKTKYEVGEVFDPAGLVVTAHYDDGTTAIINAGQYTLSEVDMSSNGKKTITVTYQDKTATFTITVGKVGCGGSIAAVSILSLALAGLGLAFVSLKRKKEF